MADERLTDEWMTKIRDRLQVLKRYLADWDSQHGEFLTPDPADVLTPDVARIIAGDLQGLLVEVDRLSDTHNAAWHLVDQLTEDLADHVPVAHDWLVDEANAWLVDEANAWLVAHPRMKKMSTN